MNFEERFRQRKYVDPTVRVEFGSFTFIFPRIAQQEHVGLVERAKDKAREKGYQVSLLDDPFYVPKGKKAQAEREEVNRIVSRWYTQLLAERLMEYIEGWVHKPEAGAPVEFAKSTAQELFAEMEPAEQIALGLTYLAKINEEAEKKTSSVQSSVNGSSNGLDTTSAPQPSTAANAASTSS